MGIPRILKRIQNIDWRYLVSRKEALLCRSLHDYSHLFFNQTTGLDWKVKAFMRLQEGEIFQSAQDVEQQERFLTASRSGFLTFRRKMIKAVKNYDRVSTQIQKLDCADLTRSQLQAVFKRFYRQAIIAPNYLTPVPIIDRLISEKILELLPGSNVQKKQRWLKILAFPEKENYYAHEERNFYKLIIAYKAGRSNFPSLLKTHLKNYSWIGARGARWNLEWTAKDVLARILDFLRQNKDPRRALRQAFVLNQRVKSQTSKLLKRLRIKKSSELYRYILLAKEYAYLRTWRTDLIYRALVKTKNLFVEIGKRAGFNENDVMYLTFPEVKSIARNWKLPVTHEEIKKRKQYFVTIILDDEYRVYSGRRWKKLVEPLRKLPRKGTETVIGNVAYPGMAKGKARLVFTGADLSKVSKGDVLVAVMTFPNYISAMQRASAFVTDEGGILCHAAIVSREMKKPCVIATKIATKVFKDGDLVEVDANKGIVQKI